MTDECQTESSQVDATQCDDKLWLVKIPNYLYEEWINTPDKSSVAKIIISDSGKSNEKNKTYKLACNPEFIKRPGVPTINNFTIMSIAKDEEKELSVGSRDEKTLALLTQESSNSDVNSEIKSIVGKVTVRCNVIPPNDVDYFAMKSQHIKTKNIPARVCKTYEETNLMKEFKPKTSGNIQKKRNLLKRVECVPRMDKDTLTNRICELFEQHQYYNIKDMVNLLNQPVNHVKDVLKTVAQISNKPSRRHMWELKPEYRCYSGPTE